MFLCLGVCGQDQWRQPLHLYPAQILIPEGYGAELGQSWTVALGKYTQDANFSLCNTKYEFGIRTNFKEI